MDTHRPNSIGHPPAQCHDSFHLVILKRRAPHLFPSHRRPRLEQTRMSTDDPMQFSDGTMDATALLRLIVRGHSSIHSQSAAMQTEAGPTCSSIALSGPMRSHHIFTLYSLGLLSCKLLRHSDAGEVESNSNEQWDKDVLAAMTRLINKFAGMLRQQSLQSTYDRCKVIHRNASSSEFKGWMARAISPIVECLKANDQHSVLGDRISRLPKILDNLKLLNEVFPDRSQERMDELRNLVESIIYHASQVRVDILDADSSGTYIHPFEFAAGHCSDDDEWDEDSFLNDLNNGMSLSIVHFTAP